MSDEEVKILQLSPAPANMFAVYHQGDGTCVKVRILCLALCEFQGHTFIEPQEFEPNYGIEGPVDGGSALLGYYLEGSEPSWEYYVAHAQELAKSIASNEKSTMN